MTTIQNSLRAVGLSLCLLLGTTVAIAESAKAPIEFDIDSQPIGDAINAFAAQTGLQVLLRVESIPAGMLASRVSGKLTPEAALTQLLANTSLHFTFIDERTIAVINPKQTKSPRTSSVSHHADNAGLIAVAQNDENRNKGAENTEKDSGAAAADSQSKPEEVVVTGSRFGNRTELTSPSPIDRISATELRGAGRTELAESLAAVVPAFNFTAVSPASTVNAMRLFTYRGLPPQDTLVLVNGKRWHPSAILGTSRTTFDFNSIAPTSVGRVEVLRDGASAQYGSDAIAGVINVQLREDTDTELVATAGQYYESDGLTMELGLDTGFILGSEGFVHVSGYFRDSDSTNRQGRDVRQQYFAFNSGGNPVVLGTAATGDLTPILPAGFTFDPREFTGVDRSNNIIFGNAGREEAGLSFNSELPLSNALTAYAFGGYTERSVDTTFTWRRPLDLQTVRAIFPDGYAPIYHAEIQDAQLLAGLRGAVGEWEWDFSHSWGFSDVDNFAERSLNVSFGAASPTNFFTGTQKLEQATTNLDLRRTFDAGLSAPINLAFGLEYRDEGFVLKAGESAAYSNGGVSILDGPSAGTAAPIGAQGVTIISPLDATDTSRNSIASYVDVELQLTETFLATAAVRYENYSDFGDTLNGKVSFLQQFTDSFAVRGSASTGFRAPTLSEINLGVTGSSIVAGNLVFARLFPVAAPAVRALGARDLEPETATNYSLGAIFRLNDFSVTADAYRIYLDDAIITSSTFSDAGTIAFLASQGFTGINAASFNTNAIDYRVDGLDIQANYSMGFANGIGLALSAGINLNTVEVLRVAATPPQLAAVTATPLFNQQRIVATESGAPGDRINLSATFDYASWQLVLRGTRYGSTQEFGTSAATQQTFGEKWVTDLELGVDATDHLRLSIGAQNVFDVYPDQNNVINNRSGAFPYPFNAGNAPFGFNGGYYYLRALARF